MQKLLLLLGNVVPHLRWQVIPRQKKAPIELYWTIWSKGYTMLDCLMTSTGRYWKRYECIFYEWELLKFAKDFPIICAKLNKSKI